MCNFVATKCLRSLLRLIHKQFIYFSNNPNKFIVLTFGCCHSNVSRGTRLAKSVKVKQLDSNTNRKENTSEKNRLENSRENSIPKIAVNIQFNLMIRNDSNSLPKSNKFSTAAIRYKVALTKSHSGMIIDEISFNSFMAFN